MKRLLIILAAFVATTAPAAASRKLIASDIKGAGITKPGKIVISNDGSFITAHQFHNDIKTALVKLRSTRSIARRSFGSAIFRSDSRVNTSVPVYLASVFENAGRQNGVDPRLLAAVARRESRFTATAVSPVGALGIMQLMPATARFLGVSNAFDPEQNIFAGAKYLKMLLETFEGDLDLTLAAYNAGPGAVQKYRGIPPYRETIKYVAAVRSDYEASLR